MPSPVMTLGLLFDRSIAQIADASVDTRTIDVPAIVTLSDIWDNNTYPLFDAVSRWPRHRRARTALAWMGDFGGGRRAWMVAQEPALDGLLPPAPAPAPWRGWDGRIRPDRISLGESIDHLRADYDLPAGEVRELRAYRVAGGLRAVLAVVLPARHGGSAVVVFLLSGVRRLRIDARDTTGITLSPDDATIGFGASGLVSAAECEVDIEDDRWHLSSAGRHADATTPDEVDRPGSRRPSVRPPRSAQRAAEVVHAAMLEVRSVRYERSVPAVAVHAIAEALRGAGRATVEAGALRGHRRDKAFRDLAATWTARLPASPRLAARLRDDLAARLRPVPPGRPFPMDGPVTLRMAAYRAARGELRPAEALVQVATEVDGSWQLAGRVVPEPAEFHLDESAFAGPLPIGSAGRALRIGDRSLTIT